MEPLSITNHFKKLIEIIEQYVWVLVLVTSVMLFSPQRMLLFISIEGIVNEFRSAIGIVFLLSFAFLITKAFSFIFHKCECLFRKRKFYNSIRFKIHSLDEFEIRIISECLNNNTQTYYGQINDPGLNSLLEKGFIYQGSGSVLSLPHIFKDDVWAIIQLEYLPDRIITERGKNEI